MRRCQKTRAEQVVLKLRQIEVQTTQGKSLALACKEAEISEQSYYRWRKEYGGLQVDQARKMKDLERENARLRRLVADLSLEAGAGGRCRGKLVLYSGFIGQRPFVRILVRRVIVLWSSCFSPRSAGAAS